MMAKITLSGMPPMMPKINEARAKPLIPGLRSSGAHGSTGAAGSC
jgi:hypothetical protein